MIRNSIICFAAIIALSGCGGSPGNKSGGDITPASEPYVNWSTVPAQFNPSIDTFNFQTHSVERIFVDAFSFDRDVRVIYSPQLGLTEGILKIYKVYNGSASWGSLEPRMRGRNLDLKNYGSYQCSIRVRNQQIQELEGGCYVRVEIILPQNIEIEVYNVGRIITRRFIPMDNQAFLKALDEATWSDKKFEVIEAFLASYTGSRKPSLTARELGQVIQEFSWKEEKFKALRRLHEFVYDRENLGKMIDDSFSYFDRSEARKIAGLG